MAEMKEFPLDAGKLYRLAEKRFGSRAESAPAASLEVQRLLQELEGCKIELEMQNAELGRAMDDVEAALEKYTDLYNLSPVSYLTLDRVGIIHNANLTFSCLIGVARSRLIGGQFNDLLVDDASRDSLAALLGKVFAGTGRASCQLALLNGANALLHVQVEAVTTGDKWLVALIDITRQKHAEAALLTEQEADSGITIGC